MLGLSMSKIIFTILFIVFILFFFHMKVKRFWFRKKNIKSNNKKAFDMKFCNSCRSYISYDYEFGFNCKINNCPWS